MFCYWYTADLLLTVETTCEKEKRAADFYHPDGSQPGAKPVEGIVEAGLRSARIRPRRSTYEGAQASTSGSFIFSRSMSAIFQRT